MYPEAQDIQQLTSTQSKTTHSPLSLQQQNSSIKQDKQDIVSQILKLIKFNKLMENYLRFIKDFINYKNTLRIKKVKIDNLGFNNIKGDEYDIRNSQVPKKCCTVTLNDLTDLTERQKLMYEFTNNYIDSSVKKMKELHRHLSFSKYLHVKALEYLVFKPRVYPYNKQLKRYATTVLEDSKECIMFATQPPQQQDKELQDYRNHLINYLLEDTQENAIITLIKNEIEDNNKLLQFNSTEKEEIKRRVLNSKELIKINKDLIINNLLDNKDLIINNLLDKEKVEEEIQENEGDVYMTKTQFEMHNATLDKLLLLSNRLLALKEKCEYYAPHISCPYNYSQCVEYIPLQRELEEIKIQINFLSLKNFQIPEPNYQFIQLFIKYNVINALKVTRLLRCLRNKKNFDPSDLELQFIGGEQLYEEILNCSAKDKCLFEIENKCYLEDLNLLDDTIDKKGYKEYEDLLKDFKNTNDSLNDFENNWYINTKSELAKRICSIKSKYYYITSNKFNIFHLPEKYIAMILVQHESIESRIKHLEDLIHQDL